MLAAPEVIGTLVDTGRGFIFDTGLAPPSAGAALAALEVVAAEPELGARARAAAARLAGIAAAWACASARRTAAVLAVWWADPARGRSGPTDLRRPRRARRLLPAAVGPPRPGLPAAGRPGPA